MIIQPFLLPRLFLILNESCGVSTSRAGLVFLYKLSLVPRSSPQSSLHLEQAGEFVLEADCLSLAALKLACLRSSLLKFLTYSVRLLLSLPRLTSPSGVPGWQSWISAEESLEAAGTSEGPDSICDPVGQFSQRPVPAPQFLILHLDFLRFS